MLPRSIRTAPRRKRNNVAADPAIDAYYAGLTGPVREIALALHERIGARGPHLRPKLSYGFPAWQGQAWVFSIVGHKAHCNLQLARGAELAADFPHLVEGTGKSLRHVKVRSVDALDAELDSVMDAAIRIDAQA